MKRSNVRSYIAKPVFICAMADCYFNGENYCECDYGPQINSVGACENCRVSVANKTEKQRKDMKDHVMRRLERRYYTHVNELNDD